MIDVVINIKHPTSIQRNIAGELEGLFENAPMNTTAGITEITDKIFIAVIETPSLFFVFIREQ